MSDWTETLPDPTLCIQYPWNEHPVGWCLNCNERVSTNAKSHAVIADHPLKADGCGIWFRYVTSECADDWINHVREMRADLTWRSLAAHHPMTDEARRLTKFEQGGSKRIQPMFAWDKAAPAGEGRAGNYLAHLRDNPPTFKPNSYFKQAAAAARMKVEELMKLPKETRFSFIYGRHIQEEGWSVDSGAWSTGKTITSFQAFKDKEALMPNYTLTVEVADLLALAKVVEAIDCNRFIDARVKRIDTPLTFEHEFTNSAVDAAYGSTPQARVHAEEKTAIREYLTKVMSANGDASKSYIEHVIVDICYEAEGTGERTTRQAIPFRIEQRSQSSWPYSRRDYLILRDVAKDAARSFLVDNILSVDGPAL